MKKRTFGVWGDIPGKGGAFITDPNRNGNQPMEFTNHADASELANILNQGAQFGVTYWVKPCGNNPDRAPSLAR